MGSDADFLGGHPCLDFLNTAGGRGKDRSPDRLTTYTDACRWAQTAGVIDRREARALQGSAAAAPGDASAALRELCERREDLHAFLSAAIDGAEPPPEVRARVEYAIRDGYSRARLSPSLANPAAWILALQDAGLRLIAERLAIASGTLLAGPERAQISSCGRCSWLFLDPSPTRRRRWCSMATCGNRAKAQRHHSRR